MDDLDLVRVARSWPADPIDAAIIHDLADALEAWIDARPLSPVVHQNSGQEVTAID